MTETDQAKFEGWAKVEVMGRQSHTGYVKTQVYGQVVFFRIDVPEIPAREYVLEQPEYIGGQWTRAGATVLRPKMSGHSVLIGAGSIYRILPCDELAAMRAIETNGRGELKLISVPEDQLIQVHWPAGKPETLAFESDDSEDNE